MNGADRERKLGRARLEVIAQRIEDRLEPDPFGGCKLWPGASSTEYGLIKIRPEATPFLTHRIIYAARIGPIPEGALVLHSCDVHRCSSEAHLFCGTHADNSQDAAAKGRFYLQRHPEAYSGAGNPNARLTLTEVDAIRAASEEGASCAALGREFGISYGHARRIVKKVAWA